MMALPLEAPVRPMLLAQLRLLQPREPWTLQQQLRRNLARTLHHLTLLPLVMPQHVLMRLAGSLYLSFELLAPGPAAAASALPAVEARVHGYLPALCWSSGCRLRLQQQLPAQAAIRCE